jgi:hypothetical protein
MIRSRSRRLAHNHQRDLDRGLWGHGKPFVAAARDLAAASGECGVHRALQAMRVLGFEFNKQARLAWETGRNLLYDAVDNGQRRAADLDDIAAISRIVNIDGLGAFTEALRRG